jgi:predicted amidophosphoribosyltransferase
MSSGLRQASETCPHCQKSFYRRDDHCNVCGGYAPIIENDDPRFSRSGHDSTGRIWDPKLHKYVYPKSLT